MIPTWEGPMERVLRRDVWGAAVGSFWVAIATVNTALYKCKCDFLFIFNKIKFKSSKQTSQQIFWRATIAVKCWRYFAIKKKEKRSNVAIVISSKCPAAVFDLRWHYPVEIHALRKQVHSVHSVLHGSVLTEVSELRHSKSVYCY